MAFGVMRPSASWALLRRDWKKSRHEVGFRVDNGLPAQKRGKSTFAASKHGTNGEEMKLENDWWTTASRIHCIKLSKEPRSIGSLKAWDLLRACTTVVRLGCRIF